MDYVTELRINTEQLQLIFYTFSFSSKYQPTASTSHIFKAVDEEHLTDDVNETKIKSTHEY